MLTIDRRKRIYILILVSLFLSSLACRVEAPRIVLSDETETPTVQVITQVITEVITPTPIYIPPTVAPTQTPEPTETPPFDPGSAPIYYPLKDCVASRLYRGDLASVSMVGGANAIRSSADLSAEGNIMAYAQPGDILKIVDGPYCDIGHIVWLVETLDLIRGFTPEGNGNEYWLFPVGP